MDIKSRKQSGVFPLSLRILLVSIVGLSLLAGGVYADNLTAMFAPVPISGPAPLNVSFVDQSEGEPVNWTWNITGNSNWINHDQNANYTFTTAGSYVINLVVDNGTGVNNSISQEILVTSPVDGPLESSFTVSPRVGYAPLNVTFIDQSVGALSWNWTLNETTYSPDKNPVFTYTTPGLYDITLNVSDNYTYEDGRISSSTEEGIIQVLPIPPPQADFTATPQSGAANLTVVFTDQTPATESLTYQWDFDDDTLVSYDRNPVHTFTEPGLYNVTVAVTGSGGTSLIKKIGYIAVDTLPAPIADFAVAPGYGTAPLNVSFIALANGTGHLTYEWDFDDGSAHEFGRNPIHQFITPDTYNVTLWVSDGSKTGSVTRNNCVIVQEAAPPVADFTGSPTKGTTPLTVSFSDFSSGLNTSPWYQWWFGDGQISNERLPVYTYNTPGSFDVCLTVISDGKTSTKDMKGFVQVSNPVLTHAMFTAIPRNGSAPLDVSFIDQSTGESPLSYEWDFGDESLIDHDQNPVHTYTKAGLYNVTMEVTGGNSSDVARQIGYIRVSDYPEPKVAFSASPVTGQAPLSVSFIDLTEPVTGAYSYAWEFGDGDHDWVKKNPVHVYETPGNYTVNLTVTDTWGVSNKTSYNSIVVKNSSSDNGPLFANFTVASTREVAPFNVQFLDLSTGAPVAWNWTFGDGAKTNEQGPFHTYVRPGVYDVTLSVYNNTMGSNTTTRKEYITALSPTVTAQLTHVYADLANTKKIQFYDKSLGVGINNWTWDFGDSSVSHEQNPLHEFASSQRYVVKLGVSNGYATDSTSYEIGIA